MRFARVAIATAALSRAASASPPRCEVAVAEGPDDVRAAIERALAGEMPCGPALVVRVVAADGGLAVDARDARGQVRSRTVPDAQTAADLVASWAADDRVRLDAADDAADAPIATVVPTYDRRATIAATIGQQQGLRGEVDLIGSHFTLGFAGIARGGTVRPHAVQRDLGALPYLAFTHAGTRWGIRTEVAAGLEYTTLLMENDSGDVWARGTKWMFVADASVTISRNIDARWSITAGFLLTVLPHPAMSAAQMSVHEELPGVAPQLVVGASCGL